MTVEVYLDAFCELRRVGIMRRHSSAGRERVSYEHDPDWLRSSEAFQFDPTLPLTPGPFYTPRDQEMFGTLGDSAPDTWGRELLRRQERHCAYAERRRARILQEADYLLGVSDFTRLGALRFKVDGEFQAQQERGVPTTIALGELMEASRRILKGEETREDLQLIFAPGSSLGGARPKASVYDQRDRLSIAKFPKETDPYSISRWEVIALDMAEAAGINAAEHDLVPHASSLIFMSRRFDRTGDGHRIPFMSGMAMTEHRDGDDNGSYLELVDAINERSAFPDRDRQELFRRIAFSILITNTDDHLRNTGFLWTGREGWTLSPAYDVNPVPDGPRILSTRIDFEDGTASIDLLRSVAEFFMPLARADQVIAECAGVTRQWEAFASRREAPSAEIKRMRTAFEHDDLARGLSLAT